MCANQTDLQAKWTVKAARNLSTSARGEAIPHLQIWEIGFIFLVRYSSAF